MEIDKPILRPPCPTKFTPYNGKTPSLHLAFSPTILPYKTVPLRKGSPCTTMEIDKPILRPPFPTMFTPHNGKTPSPPCFPQQE